MRNLFFVFIFALGCVSNNNENARNETDSLNQAKGIDSVKTVDTSIPDTATKLLKGAWFDISYPAGFTAKPSLLSSTSKDEYESAFFESPDGDVSFYVFSPQWNGNPKDIALKKGEKIISKDSSWHEDKKLMIRNWTIEPDNKNYRRSYQEFHQYENVNWIFGIQYKDSAAYEKYKQQYLNFKNSLKQYAD